MSDTNSVSTAVPASAGAATSENPEKSCPSAGKDTMQTKTENTSAGTKSAATTAEAQPKKAASAGAQADAGAEDLSPETKADRDALIGVKGKPRKGKKEIEVLIPFQDIGISEWNESYGTVFDKNHIKELASDIKKHGLMHSIVLARNKGSSGPKYTIPAGARRFEALKELRGPDSGLQIGEFIVHSKLNEDDEKCLNFSLSENNRRYGRSVIDRAQYLDRMVNVKGVKQETLGRRLGMPREAVGRLAKLPKYYPFLPKCWCTDFAFTPKSGGKAPKKTELPKITYSHWIVVAPHLVGNESGISDEISAAMEKAHAKKWSIRVLRRELEEVHPIADKGESKASKKGEKQSALERGRKKKSLRDSYEAMKQVNPALAEQIRLQLESMEKEGASSAPASEPDAEQPVADAKPATAETKPTA